MSLTPSELINCLIVNQLAAQGQLPSGYVPPVLSVAGGGGVAATPSTPLSSKVQLPTKAQERLEFLNAITDPTLLPHASEDVRTRFMRATFEEKFGAEDARRTFGKFGKKTASRELEEKKTENLEKTMSPVASVVTPGKGADEKAKTPLLATPDLPAATPVFDEQKLLKDLESGE